MTSATQLYETRPCDLTRKGPSSIDNPSNMVYNRSINGHSRDTFAPAVALQKWLISFNL